MAHTRSQFSLAICACLNVQLVSHRYTRAVLSLRSADAFPFFFFVIVGGKGSERLTDVQAGIQLAKCVIITLT